MHVQFLFLIIVCQVHYSQQVYEKVLHKDCSVFTYVFVCLHVISVKGYHMTIPVPSNVLLFYRGKI